ncbi:MAG: Unknown protein [uncultured Thiotrichaceae bacterium]|uniref:Uncharacterized protein n=1 Tax=uncultured Thiotrichaceae bacterium TaxID=298394 RepID=A0A6S6TWB6_9GAMM|nr:MAG: Unknown protein [uncultured Thiotrichaceae bacterium]
MFDDMLLMTNWPFYVLFLLLGFIFGWVIKGNCRRKLLMMEDEWRSRYQSLEAEYADVFGNASSDDAILAENKKLSRKLKQMEKGARLSAKEGKKNLERIRLLESESEEFQDQVKDQEKLVTSLQDTILKLDESIHSTESRVQVLEGELQTIGLDTK